MVNFSYSGLMEYKFKHRFSDKDVRITACQCLYDGFMTLNRYQLQHKRYDGEWSNSLSREVVERKPAVVVLPFDPVLERVVLIEEFRVGPVSAKSSSPWLFEVPAGILDRQGEPPQQAGVREVYEECGLRVGRMMPILEYWSSPGGSGELIYAFCGEVDAANYQECYHGVQEEHEDIRCFAVPVDQAFQACANGEINNGAGVIVLQWLQLNYDKVRLAFSSPS
jgi:ADP-ribose pyrophosphatase